MATSPYDDTVVVLDFLGSILWAREASILDVGAGFGRWGFLCRCHLGGGQSLTHAKPQRLCIDAVEGFEGNHSALYDCVYDRVYMGDLRAVLPTLDRVYDVVICSHVVEHLPKDEGLRVVDWMRRHAAEAVIISLPMGTWAQDAYGGNVLEEHVSVWTPADFAGREAYQRQWGNGPLRWMVHIEARSPEALWLVKQMNSPLRRFCHRVLRCVLRHRIRPHDG